MKRREHLRSVSLNRSLLGLVPSNAREPEQMCNGSWMATCRHRFETKGMVGEEALSLWQGLSHSMGSSERGGFERSPDAPTVGRGEERNEAKGREFATMKGSVRKRQRDPPTMMDNVLSTVHVAMRRIWRDGWMDGRYHHPPPR